MVDSRTLAQTVLELATKKDAQGHLDTFIQYLKDNNLLVLLPQVIAHVKRISAQSAETQSLHIKSRYALSDAEIAHIQSVTGAHGAPVTQDIDESIIGGFSASYNGNLYDGSLENQVTRLKNMLTL